MYAIFKREFLSYFRSPVGYVAIAIFSFLSGFIFYSMMGSRARLVWFGFLPMMIFYLLSGLVMLKGNIDKKILSTIQAAREKKFP